MSVQSLASSSHSMGNEKMETKTKKSLSMKESKEVRDALKVNEKLHASFFNYDAKRVQKNSEILEMALGKISNGEVSKMLKFVKKNIEGDKKL